MMKPFPWILFVACTFLACQKEETAPPVNAYIESVTLNGKALSTSTVYDMPNDSVVLTIRFSSAIQPSQWNPDKLSLSSFTDPDIHILDSPDKQTLRLSLDTQLQGFTKYRLSIYSGKNLGLNLIDSYDWLFVTALDSTPKFPVISDDSLLTLVQRRTFDYFWSYAHPVSGLARERLGSGETVTTGGSGFGLMAILTGIERKFITRAEGFARLDTIVSFLSRTSTETFHGAFSHWMNGTTGKAIAFSTKDNGADLIETAFLMQGLLTVQSYFKNGNQAEQALCRKIEALWENVEWTWFQQNGQSTLYWHWSPDYGWAMNMPINGWNEGLIAYVLAASSPTHPISASVYTNGWASNGSFRNGNTYYGIKLPLGPAYGGPLFFSHYSFLGLDPRTLSDNYANYWEQNTAHARINHAYCAANPGHHYGYSDQCWGLTSSDIPAGYTASSPTNDVGVIAPTAALASFPYTPAESLKALHFFYYTLGDKIWGDYGFKDAFNLSQPWYANSYLAIDEGPIVVMIENYRSGLLWHLFMQNTDVQTGLTKLGFTW